MSTPASGFVALSVTDRAIYPPTKQPPRASRSASRPSALQLLAESSVFFRYLRPVLRSKRRRLLLVLDTVVMVAMLTNPFAANSLAIGASLPQIPDSGTTSSQPSSALTGPQGPQSSPVVPTDTPMATGTTTQFPATATPTTQAATPTAIGTGTATVWPTPFPSPTFIQPSVTPPFTGTVEVPTNVPTVTAIPDTNYQQQASDAARDNLIASIDSLPAPTPMPGITGTLVSNVTGGRVTSADGGLTVGMRPNTVPGASNVLVTVERRTFDATDPRATRNGVPLEYTYEITATEEITGNPTGLFATDAVLIFNVDTNELADAGVLGTPRVYTYDENSSQWIEVLSSWDPETSRLVATTPHFSLYAVGDGFDKVNNYLPSVSNFEVDLQTGSATIQYPINVPAGPGGFAPKVALSYNSGNVDRVDIAQQGSSSVGWGWSLSGSYVAATQHHWRGCTAHATPIPSVDGFHPWTVSIASDGASGELVKAQDGYWHTSMESFARVQYSSGNWEAWGTDGTHYTFAGTALDRDVYNESGGLCNGTEVLVKYKWMLTSATDIHGNTINYSYWYENELNGQLSSSPITTARTRAIYPNTITWGNGGDKLQVVFNVVDRHIGGLDDVSTLDSGSGTYQRFRIDKIDVNRKQASTGSYSLLRSYQLQQSYGITITLDSGVHSYRHLTLDAIKPVGNDNTTQLPSTTFEYYNRDQASTFASIWDQGHLYYATNGYGGSVNFYYDQASGDIHSAYRRVRAKRVLDGISGSPEDTPHNVKYLYDYRGGITNMTQISADASAMQPIQTANTQFRGFAWVREQTPIDQAHSIYNSIDHYYSQDDLFKAKEWRTQVGKEDTYVDTFSTPAPTATVTSSPRWNVSGTVRAFADPANSSNPTWKLSVGASVQRTATPTGTATPTITAYLKDGSDVAMRYYITGSPDEQCTPGPGETCDSSFVSTAKLISSNGSNYWGVKLYRKTVNGVTGTYAKVIWSVGGSTGERDLSTTSSTLPHQKRSIDVASWEWVRLHTSADGRFVLELYDDDHSDPSPEGRVGNLYADYIVIRAGDGGIPLMATGQDWYFKQEVTSGDTSHSVLVDDYSETRTAFSQQDSYYENRSNSAYAPASFTWTPTVGAGNNCDGMHIYFTPLTKTLNTIYGAPPLEAGQARFTETEYDYDSLYGSQTMVQEHGDLNSTGDDRTTFTAYTNNTTSWIIGKPKTVRTYKTLMSTDTETSSNLLSKVVNYYDNATDENASPSKGDLTKVKQVGVLNGSIASDVTTSQQFGYDTTTGNQTSVTDPNGNVTTTDYDSYYKSFPIKTTYANNTHQDIGYDFTIDAVNAITDVNGTVTRSASDVFGRPLKSWIASPSGYGDTNSPNEIYKFTDAGQPSVSAPFYISYTVKLVATPAASDYAYGMRWYDGRGRVLQEMTPKDITHDIKTDTFYNDAGQVVSSTLPYQVSHVYPPSYQTTANQLNISKAYDGIGRTTVITNPDGTSILYLYSQMQWVRERNETRTQDKYTHTDLLGRVDEVYLWDPATVDQVPTLKVDYAYDWLNRLLQTTRDDGGSNETVNTMQYDALSRKSQMSDADMGTWQYEYDAAGNLKKQRDALYLSNSTTYADHQIIFDYDMMNRITAKYYGDAHYSASPKIPDVKYYYDNDMSDASAAHSWGKLRVAEVTLQGQGAEKANTHGYVYDPRGLLTWESITTTLTTREYGTAYNYDAAGRLGWMQYPDPEATHEAINVVYNGQGMGLPQQLVTNKSSVNPVDSALYNQRGQLTELVQGSVSNNYLTTDFTYDDSSTKRGWLSNITVIASGSQLLNLSMQYSDNGNITQVNQSASGTNNPSFSNTYTYDAFDRLKTASSSCPSCPGGGKLFVDESYLFDSLSRMTYRTIDGTLNQITYTDSAHKDAPTGYLTSSYGYDAVGNQITHTVGSNVQTRLFDAEGRVTQVVSGTYATSYIYDANGTRVIKAVKNTASSGDSSGGSGGKVGNGGAGGTGGADSLPSAGLTQRTLYFGSYEEELPPSQPSSWTSVSSASVSTPSNVLSKTGSNSAWDAGAISSQSISSSDADGFVSVVADATNTRRIFGLGNTNQNASDGDIEFGLYLRDDGTLEVLENGTSKGNKGSYSVGDVLKVTAENGGVKYYRNNTVIYTSKLSPSYPLYLDTSIYTPGAKLVGALLCAGSSCTSSPTTPPYTSYYTFGGKLVGMRRANYSAGNGQLRIVGDHLGSTTLIVDTFLTVVQRQYSNPYGETAWQYTASSSGGASLTSVGYTGQRTDEDSTGLMFYNARLYDPVLSHFLSGDTVAPDPIDPLGRTRYGYVSANPLKYIDPTGHNQKDYERCAAKRDAAACKADFADLGITLEGDWDWSTEEGIAEILAVLEGIHKLMEKAEWSYGDFRHAMGIDIDNGLGGDGHIDLVIRRHRGQTGAPHEGPEWDWARGYTRNVIDLYDNTFTDEGGAHVGRTIVHELAHVWDGPALGCQFFGCLSTEMKVRTGSSYNRGIYQPQDGQVDFGATNHFEDFAEAVAAYVYPDDRRFYPDGDPTKPILSGYAPGSTRWDFVKEKFEQYRRK